MREDHIRYPSTSTEDARSQGAIVPCSDPGAFRADGAGGAGTAGQCTAAWQRARRTINTRELTDDLSTPVRPRIARGTSARLRPTASIATPTERDAVIQ